MLTLNLCTSCGEDFSSVSMFDAHRVGRHDPYARRCLTEDEMRRKGWEKNQRDRWCDPVKNRRVSDAFRKASLA